MAKVSPKLNAAARRLVPDGGSERVRMGPVSLFALVVIIGLAVLALLAFSTANASLVMSQRQADAVSASYANERAAQEFVAGIDAALAGAPADAGAQAVEASLESTCESARRAAPGVTVAASVEDDKVRATFSGANGKALEIELAVLDGGAFRVESWKTKAVQNEEQPPGQLLKVDE